MIYIGGNDPETAHSIAISCNKTTQSVLPMPLCTSWIFRRGEKPYMCKNLELDDYLSLKGIYKVEEKKTEGYEKKSGKTFEKEVIKEEKKIERAS